ncbi:MAG: hypothetical protein LBI05_07755 [Planctomycetaceae bacterium]|nr:hypothetical protein [Planctomycetaceae bacterium]
MRKTACFVVCFSLLLTACLRAVEIPFVELEGVTIYQGTTNYITTAVISPDGKKIATGGSENTVSICDSVTGKKLLKLEGHTNTIYGSIFSPDGTKVLTYGRDNTVRKGRGRRNNVQTNF